MDILGWDGLGYFEKFWENSRNMWFGFCCGIFWVGLGWFVLLVWVAVLSNGTIWHGN